MCFYQDNLFLIQTVLKIPLSEAVKAPIEAKEELFDNNKYVVDGHLHFHDYGVASVTQAGRKSRIVVK